METHLTEAWHPLVKTTASEARSILETALAQESRLTQFGIGIYNERSKLLAARKSGDNAQVQKEFELERKALESEAVLLEIAACADWVKEQAFTKSFNAQHTSYTYKDFVEKWIDYRGGPRLDVSNGSFIAAAVGLGCDRKLKEQGSPNMLFKFSERSVKQPGAKAGLGSRKSCLTIEDAAAMISGSKVIDIPDEWWDSLDKKQTVWNSLYRWLVTEHGQQEVRLDLHQRTFAGKELINKLYFTEKRRIRKIHNLQGNDLLRNTNFSYGGQGPLENLFDKRLVGKNLLVIPPDY